MSGAVLGALVERVRDRVAAGSGSGPFVGLEHLVPDQLRIEGSADAAEQRSDGVAFRGGDVLFGALRPGFRKAVVAGSDGVGSAELLVLRPRPGEHPGFVLACLTHPDTVAACVAMATGTRMPRVRWRDLAELPVPVPDAARRWAIGELAAQLDARLGLVHRRQATAAALLHSAVARAVDGGGPRLGDVAHPRGPAETAAGAPVLSVADLPGEGLAIHTWGTDPGRSAKRPVRVGDLLVSRLRPALRKSGVCPVDGTASPEIVAWVVEPAWRGVVAGRIVDARVQDRWIALGSGTRMPRVPMAALAHTPLGVEPAAARALAPILAPLLERLVQGVHLAGSLRALRDRTLRDLLDGSLDPGRLPPTPPPSPPCGPTG